MSLHTNLLIVDDDAHTLEALKRLFQKDYKVFTAQNAHKALVLLKKNIFSAIICDQRMPRMSGVEMLEKSLVIQPKVIRILITAYADVEAVVSAINKGHVYHYETKPWDRDKLKNVLKRGIQALNLEIKIERQNQELKKAYKKLLTLDHAKDQFINMISHELKTPLTSIMGFSHMLLEDTKTNTDLAVSVQKIAKSSEKLLEIVNKIVLISELEAGTYKIKRALSPLPPPIKGGGTINADPKLAEILFSELLNNAAQYATKKNQIEIQTSHNKKKITIMISNSCRKIPQGVLERFGTKFSMGPSKLHYGGGLGLGLPLAKAIMEAHHGSLKLDYKKGKFQVTLSFPA
ncbi:MAG: hybrid sensor histidine kinase/response regulator [Deltaproteobacteria bacterium]|nr:hybrid sensor histidine kinase/response regulator [Deltaproteobacteria bacterium]